VRATRALSEAQLAAASLPRLQALMAEGVTTLESKSGYGLNLDDEIKQLRVARQLADSQPVEIAPTLLSAHALPPEFAGNADGYIAHVIRDILPSVAEQAWPKRWMCSAKAWAFPGTNPPRV
jgi:imidazolonepropionase